MKNWRLLLLAVFPLALCVSPYLIAGAAAGTATPDPGAPGESEMPKYQDAVTSKVRLKYRDCSGTTRIQHFMEAETISGTTSDACDLAFYAADTNAMQKVEDCSDACPTGDCIEVERICIPYDPRCPCSQSFQSASLAKPYPNFRESTASIYVTNHTGLTADGTGLVVEETGADAESARVASYHLFFNQAQHKGGLIAGTVRVRTFLATFQSIARVTIVTGTSHVYDYELVGAGATPALANRNLEQSILEYERLTGGRRNEKSRRHKIILSSNYEEPKLWHTHSYICNSHFC